ncbi:hypothetical protein A1O3_02812 [Capronia epimyces CBS 606.96]|uniref:RNA polymerase II-associated protein RBA50 n=1 Tax=Capronia epimyces CBS 606.96 TaxID=1182542 RepID=W9YJ75_9EURO|nr:uncharacterized protein A1O3_02812 [Capronia epimyces CBS 606.96]EXJ89745.1 hypothetical protein A1O3_02812 [Capronia epimyces CBS 606.96]
MAIPGQRFELDLDADDFTVRPLNEDFSHDLAANFAVKEVREHEAETPPPPPSLKSSKSGFPEHRPRRNISDFKKRQQAGAVPARPSISSRVEPSDRAIAHHVGKKYGVDLETQQKAEISEENKRRLAEMSVEDIAEARAELMSNLNPAFLERLLKRANIDEDQPAQEAWPRDDRDAARETQPAIIDTDTSASLVEDKQVPTTSIHFPAPPRSAEDYTPLDTDDPSFLTNLKSHYFPETPHDPSSLQWLQDPTEEELKESLYNPEKDSFLASALRFGFNGRLIAPRESLEIDVKQGLHHHGDDPSSAGYTIPELAILARSTLPNQRCVAYQILGRVLYRLGRGDFGARGSELEEALWSVVEREKPIEVIMSEANRQSGHASAKAHAIEALWLWRKGGGGDRGVLKPGQRVAK